MFNVAQALGATKGEELTPKFRLINEHLRFYTLMDHPEGAVQQGQPCKPTSWTFSYLLAQKSV